jgi:hypothetical protein
VIAHRLRRGRKRARGTVLQLAARVVALSNYLVDADPDKLRELQRVSSLALHSQDLGVGGVIPGEKVIAFGSRCFEGSSLADWQIEMIAVASRAPRSADPLEHVVLSFRCGEFPTAEQSEEAVSLFLDVLGGAECQAIWSLHGNTDNAHVHLLLNRIDPLSGRATSLGAGWDIDAMHRAVALIEAHQGWASERKSRYFVEDEQLVRRDTGEVVGRTSDYGIKPARMAPVADEDVRASSKSETALRSNARLNDDFETDTEEDGGKTTSAPVGDKIVIAGGRMPEDEGQPSPSLRSNARLSEEADAHGDASAPDLVSADGKTDALTPSAAHPSSGLTSGFSLRSSARLLDEDETPGASNPGSAAAELTGQMLDDGASDLTGGASFGPVEQQTSDEAADAARVAAEFARRRASLSR